MKTGRIKYKEVEVYYDTVSSDKKEDFISERDNTTIKVQVGQRVFGVPEKEYRAYLGDMLEKKLNEIIYHFNSSQYVEGFGQYEEILEKYKAAKETIKQYYIAGTFLEECGGITPTDLGVVTSIIKSDLSTEKEKVEGEAGIGGINKVTGYTVTENFTLMANANYLVKWKFTYTVDNEGNMSEVEASEIEAVKNPTAEDFLKKEEASENEAE